MSIYKKKYGLYLDLIHARDQICSWDFISLVESMHMCLFEAVE
jgi:hypothetical protein